MALINLGALRSPVAFPGPLRCSLSDVDDTALAIVALYWLGGLIERSA